MPHSEIFGSKGARASPKLIAACHVLHRLSTPRHPSEALMRLIVLSKTHAWGRLPAQVRNQASAHTCALSLPDNDVFTQIPPPNEPHSPPGKPFTSQCHRSTRTWPDGRDFAETCHSTIARESLGASWWSQTGSNRRPHACKARALPAELWPRIFLKEPAPFAHLGYAGHASLDCRAWLRHAKPTAKRGGPGKT